MPDSPDYSKYLSGSVRFSLQDMGELAARLKSPMVYDRRGELMWYDQCGHGLGSWFLQGGGAGFAHETIADNVFLGNYCYRLTAGATLNKLARITKQMALFDVSSIGLEVAWFHNSGVETFDIKIQIAHDGFQYQGALRHDITNGKVQYQNSSNVWTDLDSITFPLISGSAYRFSKLVVNYNANVYRRVMIGTNHYNDLVFPIYNAGASPTHFFQVVLEVTSVSGSNGIVHVGQIIVTSNEP